MEGGALLGQGTYGCVFTPPLRCINKVSYKSQKGDVGKITATNDIINEITASKVLGNAMTEHFILPNANSVCHPNLRNKTSDDDLAKCNFIKEVHREDVIQYVMPYGGLTIHKMFRSVKHNKEHIPLYPFVRHILEAGAELALHGYVHFDIHIENVIIDTKTFLPRLIDFGQSFSANTITDTTLQSRFKMNSIDWDPEPPEFTLITYLRHGNDKRTIAHDIVKGKRILRSAEFLLGLKRQKQFSQLMSFVNSSKTIREKDWEGFIKLYWSVYDSWSIGVVILMLIIEINTLYSDTTGTPHYNEIKQVLRGLLYTDPRIRLDCVEALLILDPENSIANSPTAKLWKKGRDEIRDTLKL
jgi:serine/threonine protein kinase